MSSSSLTEQLRRVIATPGASPPREQPVGPRVEWQSLLRDVLSGRWEEHGGRRCFVVDHRMPPENRCGRSTIGCYAASIAAAAVEARLLTVGNPALPFVFFDLETTGLNGGAGTCAFLIGCGWFDDEGGFVTRQYLLENAINERPMLEAVAALLMLAGTLVSFNGKSFDAPVLETRYLLHRLDWSAISSRVHFDVLHPSRRFWPATGESGAGSCSLSSLEQHVLKVRRIGDIPSMEIPARYFQFIRSGDPRPLHGVLEHNRLDLVAVAGLTARLLHLVSAGPDEAWSAGELLALGRTYAGGGRDADARDAFERAVELGRGTPVALEALRWLAIVERRARRHQEAAGYWEVVLNMPGCPAPLAREASHALAVHHEHRLRNLTKARAYAERGLAASGNRTWTDAVRHRLARIDRKMASAPLLDGY
jgi:uncharacterized protein YprB with RNaseH-like and TPR domain